MAELPERGGNRVSHTTHKAHRHHALLDNEILDRFKHNAHLSSVKGARRMNKPKAGDCQKSANTRAINNKADAHLGLRCGRAGPDAAKEHFLQMRGCGFRCCSGAEKVSLKTMLQCQFW